ncbi:Dual specificity protein phosphatase cdc14a [Chytridiales sp. JEL 0842]|nr:Dual specificity protein phosphatase cdc14a [Chytridiales sp. JEL 0842]
MPYQTTSAHVFHQTTSFSSSSAGSGSDGLLGNAREFIKDKLYFTSLSQPPAPHSNIHFFSVDSTLVYINFFADFGPNNLAHVIRFCDLMKAKMQDPVLSGKKICLWSSMDGDKRVNAAFFMCVYMMIVQKKTPEEAYAPLTSISPPFLPYRDAGYGPATYHITIPDILKGLSKALHLGLVDLENIDPDEEEFYEKVENGDLNWLTGKFIALASPKDDEIGRGIHPQLYINPPHGGVASTQQQQQGGYNAILSAGIQAVTGLVSRPNPQQQQQQQQQKKKVLLPAYRIDDLITHLKAKGVTTLVRLNNKLYDRQKFLQNGIDHVDLYFPDGTTPPDSILKRFLDLCESTKGVIAVHCKAGLGRTGTLIAAFLMKHYKFSASEVIGLLRVLRPGSVVGPQQNYLQSMQTRLWKMHPSVALPREISMLNPPTFPISTRYPAAGIYTPPSLSLFTKNTQQSKFQQKIQTSNINSRTNANVNSPTTLLGSQISDMEIDSNSDLEDSEFQDSSDQMETESASSPARWTLEAIGNGYVHPDGKFETEGGGGVAKEGYVIPVQPRKHVGNPTPSPSTTTTTTSSSSKTEQKLFIQNTSSPTYSSSSSSFAKSSASSYSTTTTTFKTPTSASPSLINTQGTQTRYKLRTTSSNSRPSSSKTQQTVQRSGGETDGVYRNLGSSVAAQTLAGTQGFVLTGVGKGLSLDGQEKRRVGSAAVGGSGLMRRDGSGRAK